MWIYIVCLIHREEGTEPPYKAFTTEKAARRYGRFELPYELGSTPGTYKEDEDWIIYSTELED
ncbi:MAG: hypothetical protein M3033_15985 [Acidobacteriota bacterium]|nr:hypothetical protein [Acidobacteriota bacterium]